MQQSQKRLELPPTKQLNLGNQKELILAQDELDTLNVGNVTKVVSESDFFGLLGLRRTNYPYNNYEDQIPLSENTKKQRGFYYVKVSRHVTDEFLNYMELNLKTC